MPKFSSYLKLDKNESSAHAGFVALLTIFVIIISFGWFVVDPSVILVQLPIFIISLGLCLYFGAAYTAKSSPWMGAIVLGILYFGQDLVLWRNMSAGGGGDLQSVIKGGIALLLLIYGVLNGFGRCTRHWILILFLIYALYSLISAAYSSAPFLGVGSGLAILGISLAAARGATQNEVEISQYWFALYIFSTLICILSFFLLAASPMLAQDFSDPGTFRFKGILGSANSLGPIMSAGIFMSILVAGREIIVWRRNFYKVSGMGMFVALMLTNSRSSILALVIGFLVRYLWIGKRGITAILMLVGLFAFTLVIQLWPSAIKDWLPFLIETTTRSGDSSELANFTGRRSIWEACWGLIQAQPLYGYGLGSVRVELSKTYSDIWGNTVHSAHNFLLESLISVGVVGTLPLVVVLVFATFGLAREVNRSQASNDYKDKDKFKDRDLAECGLCCMICLLISGSMEKSFAGTVAPATALLGVCIATYVYFKLKRGKTNQLEVTP